MIGDGVKKVQKCEIKNMKLVRKSIVAKKNIKKNDIFNFENLTTKRPGQGISPFLIKKLINKKTKRNYYKDELIKL
jgi:N,N'-diacetyllegionaminate synthase